MERRLLADKKERAEHVMLVDLGRNDVGRVAKPGSVTVDSFMHVERYSHVMHIVSNVTGQLDVSKTRIHQKNADILQANCIQCHKDFVHDVVVTATSHGESLKCTHCHLHVGHGPPR